MKKETVVAIFLGIILGVIVALVIITQSRQQEISKAKPITPGGNITPTVAIVNSEQQSLEISAPQDKSIVSTDSVTIKGRAYKDALIIIQSPVKDLALKNQKTEFSTDFPLALGENVIKIVVYPKDPSIRSQEKELRVYYLDEK